MQELQQILDQALQQFAVISDDAELEQVKARYLGKEDAAGLLTYHGIKLPPELL